MQHALYSYSFRDNALKITKVAYLDNKTKETKYFDTALFPKSVPCILRHSFLKTFYVGVYHTKFI